MLSTDGTLKKADEFTMDDFSKLHRFYLGFFGKAFDLLGVYYKDVLGRDKTEKLKSVEFKEFVFGTLQFFNDTMYIDEDYNFCFQVVRKYTCESYEIPMYVVLIEDPLELIKKLKEGRLQEEKEKEEKLEAEKEAKEKRKLERYEEEKIYVRKLLKLPEDTPLVRCKSCPVPYEKTIVGNTTTYNYDSVLNKCPECLGLKWIVK